MRTIFHKATVTLKGVRRLAVMYTSVDFHTESLEDLYALIKLVKTRKIGKGNESKPFFC